MKEKIQIITLLPFALILSLWFLFEEYIYIPIRSKYRLWKYT